MVLVGVLAAALIAAWVGALRAHLHRQRARASEWEGTGERPELWTSAARCANCGARGGLLDTDGDALWFECLACGHRARRRTRG